MEKNNINPGDLVIPENLSNLYMDMLNKTIKKENKNMQKKLRNLFIISK